DPHDAGDRHDQRQRQPRWAARSLAVLGWAGAVVAVAAAVGWLYLLDRVHALSIGPRAGGALPLEELASRGAQPLGRMVLAWVPAGVAAALALLKLARTRGTVAVAGVSFITTVLLFVSTAVSEALARNERVTEHLDPALSRSGLWVA